LLCDTQQSITSRKSNVVTGSTFHTICSSYRRVSVKSNNKKKSPLYHSELHTRVHCLLDEMWCRFFNVDDVVSIDTVFSVQIDAGKVAVVVLLRYFQAQRPGSGIVVLSCTRFVCAYRGQMSAVAVAWFCGAYRTDGTRGVAPALSSGYGIRLRRRRGAQPIPRPCSAKHYKGACSEVLRETLAAPCRG